MGFYDVYSQKSNIQLNRKLLRRESIHELLFLEYDSKKDAFRKEVKQ